MGVLMVDPPSVAAAVASPRALARESPPSTTACRRREHGPGRWTTVAAVFRDPDRTGTIARVYLSRNGVDYPELGIGGTIPRSGLSRVVACWPLFPRILEKDTRHSPNNVRGRDAGVHGDPNKLFLQ